MSLASQRPRTNVAGRWKGNQGGREREGKSGWPGEGREIRVAGRGKGNQGGREREGKSGWLGEGRGIRVTGRGKGNQGGRERGSNRDGQEREVASLGMGVGELVLGREGGDGAG